MRVVRNIVIRGMTGGTGHVGMITQGFGGIPPILSGEIEQITRAAAITQELNAAAITQEGGAVDISQENRAATITQRKRSAVIT